jgi:hypothetical protein
MFLSGLIMVTRNRFVLLLPTRLISLIYATLDTLLGLVCCLALISL